MYYDYTNNEDAGDLEAMGLADYVGEMAEQRAEDARRAFVEQYDSDMRGPFMLFDANGPFVVSGPIEQPHCDCCGAQLTRETEGRVGPYAVLLCGQECLDLVRNRPSWSSGREFPTYG